MNVLKDSSTLKLCFSKGNTNLLRTALGPNDGHDSCNCSRWSKNPWESTRYCFWNFLKANHRDLVEFVSWILKWTLNVLSISHNVFLFVCVTNSSTVLWTKSSTVLGSSIPIVCCNRFDPEILICSQSRCDALNLYSQTTESGNDWEIREIILIRQRTTLKLSRRPLSVSNRSSLWQLRTGSSRITFYLRYIRFVY